MPCAEPGKILLIRKGWMHSLNAARRLVRNADVVRAPCKKGLG